jgi:hypothetical protein
MANNNPDIFSQSGDFQITLKYICDYDSTNEVTSAEVKFNVDIGYSENVIGNGGFRQTVSESIRILPVVRSGSNNSGQSFCQFAGQYYGRTPEKTLQFTFTPTGFAEYSQSTRDSYRFSIRKFGSTFGSRLIITSLKIQLKNTQYSSVYNNKLYNIFDFTPEIGDILPLPATQVVDGVTSSIAYSGGAANGLPISIRFGNGIFTSGSASAFSSIWEYGVWNEGWRYDNNVIYFTNFMSFNGTQKPLVYAGALETKKVKAGEVANEFDKNFTQLKPTQRIFTLALYRTIGKLYFDDGQVVNQEPTPEERQIGTNTLRSQLKVGDRVSVGNVVAIDINGERRLITDTFKVVDIVSPANSSEGNLDIVYLQITLNFDAKTIKRDSEEHLINVTKNAWLNGAFLNGVFKGVWTNGLFKGRPYITKIKDSQWISGIFDGGHFQAKTLQYPVGSDEDLATFSAPTGVIQNFIFKDNDLSSVVYQHNYNSWIDVNYYTSSTVNIGEDTVSFFEPENFLDLFNQQSINPIGEYSKTNFWGFPTNDVLRSVSILRNHTDLNYSTFYLGINYKESTNYLEVDNGDIIKRGLRDRFGINPIVSLENNIGSFNKYYNTVGTSSLIDRIGVGKSNFLKDGFTYGIISKLVPDPEITSTFYAEPPGYISNRGDNEGVLEIRPNAQDRNGTVLNFDNLENSFITNNFSSQRYNYISFDYIQTGSPYFTFGVIPPDSQSIVDNSYLNLTNRGVTKVKEYFYNKRGLEMTYLNFYPNGSTVSTKIDNLKFVETDMVPFFLLGTESRINQKVAIPLGAVSPFIDFRDNETGFLDLLVISETIFTPLQNPSVVVTPGGGSSDTRGKLDQLLDPTFVASVAPGNITGGGLAVIGGSVDSTSNPKPASDTNQSKQGSQNSQGSKASGNQQTGKG